jgi:hypothetical protein
VSRVIDDTLDQALRSRRFILVVGDSKAGKSRTAYEAATRLQCTERLHDLRVLVPKSADLLDPSLDLSPEPALLWLDDLTESALVALTPALLDRLTSACDYRSAGDQSGGRIKFEGAIDMSAIRDEVTCVMEGGEKAFKLRMDKYGF